MALEERIGRLNEILGDCPVNPNLVKRQLTLISWLPAHETTKDKIEKSLLPRMIDYLRSQKVPPDVRLEADRIQARWNRGVYGPPVCIKRLRSTGPGSHGFVSGDCWPSREAMFNEGCHGTLQSGIHGDDQYGAFSIVANGVYDNRDTGESIWYAGTNPTDSGEPSTDTQRLITSYNTGNPVRVFRGANSTTVMDENQLAPARGFRYDGLYTVKECQAPVRPYLPPPPPGTYEFLLQRNSDEPQIQSRYPDVKPDDETLLMWHQNKLYGTI